jgi:AraC family transcriptional regulator of arabinose operon
VSTPSNWPLPSDGVRFVLPQFLVVALGTHPLSRELYPLSFGYYPRARGHSADRPVHDDHLLIYCSTGRGWLHVDGNRIDVSGGDLVLLKKGCAHAYAAADDDPWTLHWVHFDGERAADYCRHADGTPLAVTSAVGTSPGLIADFDALLAARHAGYRLPPFLLAANRLKQLLVLLAQEPGARPDPLLERSESVMRAHLDRPLGLETLATAVGLSKYHYAKRFKALTGTSPIQRFIHLKIERACRLLDLTDAPIAAIAAELGYEDGLYFSRVFRNVVGTSPRGYRALRRG